MKALRFLGVAILACSMLFVSCKKDQNYTITVKSNNDAWGTVTGGGSYAANATATLTATAKDGYQFVKWDDGTTNNPRTITVTKNATYTATFEARPVASTQISFNNSTWTAEQVYALDYSSGGYLAYYIFKSASAQTEDTYLLGWLQSTAGTYDYESSDGDYMKYYDLSYIYTADAAGAEVLECDEGDQYYGWNADAYSFAETVTAVDLNATWTTATFSEEIFDIANYVAAGGQSYGDTKTLNGNMNQAPWTLYEGKAAAKKVAPKFEKVK